MIAGMQVITLFTLFAIDASVHWTVDRIARSSPQLRYMGKNLKFAEKVDGQDRGPTVFGAGPDRRIYSNQSIYVLSLITK